MKFRAGESLLDDAPRSGRPAEADGDQIETLTENNQHYAMGEGPDRLKISKSIKLLMKMRMSYFKGKTIWTLWPTQQILNNGKQK